MSNNQEFYDRIEQHLAAARKMAGAQLDDPTNHDVLQLLQQICLEQHRLVITAEKRKAKDAAKAKPTGKRARKSDKPDPWRDLREP